MSLTNVVKTAALALGVSISMAATQAVMAENFNISLVAGGSSALLGNFQSNFGPYTGAFSQGALPQAIQAIAKIGSNETVANSGYNGASYKQYKNNSTQVERLIAIRSADPQGDVNAAGKRYVLTAAQATQANTVLVSPNSLVAQINPTVAATDPTAKFEVINDALIRYTPANGTDFNGDKNVIVLLRTDSGQGVRYVTNNMKIVQFPATSLTVGATTYSYGNYGRISPDPNGGPVAGGTANPTDANDLNVINYLRGAASGTTGLPIDTGFSDVAADTVIRYAGFSGLVPGPYTNKFVKTPLAIQTLLLLHNANIVATNNIVVNFPQHIAQNITGGFALAAGTGPINWSNVDPRLPANPIRSVFREKTSGTRMTYLVDILRTSLKSGDFIGENAAGNSLLPGTGVTNQQSGTGAVLNTINGSISGNAAYTGADTYGYAFVTGGAGNGKTNIRVGAYNGVLPFRRDPLAATSSAEVSGASISLPGNGAQSSYTTVGGTADPNTGLYSPYYTETINGRYTLWSEANAFTTTTSLGKNEQSVISDILAAFTSPATQNVVYGQGLVLSSDLLAKNVVRDSFQSAITGEFVTDGLLVNFDATGPLDANGQPTTSGTLTTGLVQ